MKAARIYQRVSTEEQNLERQNALIEKAKIEGYYIAGSLSSSILTALPVCHWLKQRSWSTVLLKKEHFSPSLAL